VSSGKGGNMGLVMMDSLGTEKFGDMGAMSNVRERPVKKLKNTLGNKDSFGFGQPKNRR
jgi:hypothetical protein